MERLTKKISKAVQDKYNLGSYLYCDFANADDTNKLLNKLGAFEDFMEEQEFTSLEDLRAYIKLQSNGSKNLIQENQALKDRWARLKRYMLIEKDWGLDENFIDYSYAIKLVLEKMQELEKEGN